MLPVAHDYIFFKRCLLHSAANLLPLCKKMTSRRRLLPAKPKIPEAVPFCPSDKNLFPYFSSDPLAVV